MTRHRLTAALLIGLASAAPAAAQSQFAPRIVVDGRAVTNYEVNQRAQMLRLFNAQGDLEEQALQGLIDDRLRMKAAKAAKITATPEEIKAGMEEFAGRANLTADAFLAALAQNGVQPETFRDFVEAGLLWREVVRAKFGPVSSITDVEIDRAVAKIDQSSNVRLQVSEIVIPLVPGQEAQGLARARAVRARVVEPADFAALAREFSSAPSRGRGGAMGAISPEDLPEAARERIRVLQPGQVTQPTVIDGTVRLYQLNGGTETPGARVAGKKIDYAEFLLPGDLTGPAEAAKIRASVDRCDDLYGIAKGLRADRLRRQEVAEASLPRDVAERVALLDPNESTDFQRGQSRVFLMLCSRNPNLDPGPQRDAVRVQLLNQRLAAAAENYLQKLRSDALIVQP